jgi:hypothetical protein
LQADALHNFVEKEEKSALADCVTHSLANTQTTAGGDEETIAAADRGADLSAALRKQAMLRRNQQVTTYAYHPSFHLLGRLHLQPTLQLPTAALSLCKCNKPHSDFPACHRSELASMSSPAAE